MITSERPVLISFCVCVCVCVCVCMCVHVCVCVCVLVRLELIRAERENAMFPDEVDTPQDTPARIRFQKYTHKENSTHT